VEAEEEEEEEDLRWHREFPPTRPNPGKLNLWANCPRSSTEKGSWQSCS
jgi:hypothetical protein